MAANKEAQKPDEGGYHSRFLTAGEKALIRSIFCNKVDVEAVTIRRLPKFSPYSTMAPFGHMIFTQADYRDDFSSVRDVSSRMLFVHEATHVWQYQSGRSVVWEAIAGYFSKDGEYGAVGKYPEAIQKVSTHHRPVYFDFHRMNLEQQARLVAGYNEFRDDIKFREQFGHNFLRAGLFDERSCKSSRSGIQAKSLMR